jgi:molybdopterin molybdotransferase
MSLFDTYIMVDWSGGKDTGPKPRKDAIWVSLVRGRETLPPVYLRNRAVAETWLTQTLTAERGAGRRVCAGFDFAFGYPRGFAQALTGSDDPLTLWDWFEARVEDDAEAGSNRCEVASRINGLFPGIGPFWGNPYPGREFEHLPRKGSERTCDLFPERRAVEDRATGSFACWQLSGAGAVGSQVITGLPVLSRLRRHFGADVAVWPFEPLTAPIALVEIWPSLISKSIARHQSRDEIKDAAQVRVLAEVMARLDSDGVLAEILADAQGQDGEGWIFGVGHEELLSAAAGPRAPAAPARLPNDCFALPSGVDWTPVDTALASLRRALTSVVGIEKLPVHKAAGRVLAGDAFAKRANPPAPNSAIDGYGFAFDHMADAMPVIAGRAAAGAVLREAVPAGKAVRILTGAVLPEGVDTVVMQEECELDEGTVRFTARVKPGQNTRAAGEDVHAGECALKAGHLLRPQDLALLTALGLAEVDVFSPLRVGVLSTGDELIEPDEDAPADRTFDANRPMLLSLAQGWGYTAVDLGHVRDDRGALRARLQEGAGQCDVILTSGGASAGDEDHVSALLREEGALSHWRIAIKPGRPLALAMFDGVPVFGLPGNPVAAFVCGLIFARPALSLLAGMGWTEPQGFALPAGFSKSKKQGRREFLRARIGEDGRAEVFHSEGSGRISGLSWADGLVELPDEAMEITPGDPVRYIPFASFGL